MLNLDHFIRTTEKDFMLADNCTASDSLDTDLIGLSSGTFC